MTTNILKDEIFEPSGQVSSHWRYLSEQDVLWRPRAAERGWFLPYSPPPTQHGAWKQYYVMCVGNRGQKPLSEQVFLKFYVDFIVHIN